eukprot:SAG11_NODE_2464_length_3326_cov_7.981097_4_plen_153_part_00
MYCRTLTKSLILSLYSLEFITKLFFVTLQSLNHCGTFSPKKRPNVFWFTAFSSFCCRCDSEVMSPVRRYSFCASFVALAETFSCASKGFGQELAALPIFWPLVEASAATVDPNIKGCGVATGAATPHAFAGSLPFLRLVFITTSSVENKADI